MRSARLFLGTVPIFSTLIAIVCMFLQATSYSASADDVSDISTKTAHRKNPFANLLIGKDPVKIQLGAYNYLFPKAYLAAPYASDCNHRTVTLLLNSDRFGAEKPRGPVPKVSIIMTTGTKNELGQTLLESGFISSKQYRGPHKEMPEEVHNLNVLNALIPNDNEHLKRNIYYRSKKQGLETYIECDIGGAVNGPACEHHIASNDAFITMKYSLDYLPQWGAIETETVLLLLSPAKVDEKSLLDRCS